MFLINPTLKELQTLDMGVLLDMLTYQTRLHFQLLKTEGFSSSVNATKELIHTIHAAIEIKKNLEKNQSVSDNNSNTAPTQDIPSINAPLN